MEVIFTTNGQLDNIESKLLNFESVYKYFTAVKTYNILKNEGYDYFKTKYLQLTSTRNYSTRFNGFYTILSKDYVYSFLYLQLSQDL